MSNVSTASTEVAEVAPPDLNLLLEWPAERTRPQWVGIFAASVALHAVLFFLAVQIPSVIGHNAPEPQRTIERHVPLYIPRDILTQKEPNRQKPSKQIDLADLLASQASRPTPAAPRPSTKHFEVPKQVTPKQLAKNAPQILPEAPNVAVHQPAALPSGSPTGLPSPAPPPPAPSASPFQDIGAEAPPNPHPKLKPPQATVQAAVQGLAQDADGRKLVISDDAQTEPMPSSPGSMGQAPAQHAAVELQSDPQGADFRPYLTRILAIVRANWRRVIPESARMGILRGRTVIEFMINKDGSIPKLVTADPSGSEPLDRAAVAGLSMSNPLPPLPADYKGMQVRLAFSFAYNMPAE
ncbi:MAG TPA: TonB family protein [Bryobacteraceae bacterium]|jgi:TonB family protein|nr:TonB family protein [Bryobacteraceae bacterium]